MTLYLKRIKNESKMNKLIRACWPVPNRGFVEVVQKRRRAKELNARFGLGSKVPSL